MKIRPRKGWKDDPHIYRLIQDELLPWAKKSNPNQRMDKKNVRERLRNGKAFVALNSSSRSLCGFINLLIQRDMLNIDMLAMHRNYQNRGLGSELIRYAEEFGRRKGCRRSVLVVDDTNQRAIYFYAKKGYHTVRHDPVHNCYMMEKPI